MDDSSLTLLEILAIKKKKKTALLSKANGFFRQWQCRVRKDVLGKASEMEQTGQTSQLAICSQGRFSKWFLFFKSSSYSPHQKPLNLNQKKKKKIEKEIEMGFPLFPSNASKGEEKAEPSLPKAGAFQSGTVSLRPPWAGLRLEVEWPLESFPFPFFSPLPPYTPLLCNFSIILTCPTSSFIFSGFHN